MRTPKQPCDLWQLWAHSLILLPRSSMAEQEEPRGSWVRILVLTSDLMAILTHKAATGMQPGEAGAGQAISKCGFLLPTPPPSSW